MSNILSRANPESVREWAAERYCSDTLIDQDRRMVAAETEAFVTGRDPREVAPLVHAAKYAGPVTSPEDWHIRQVGAMMFSLRHLGLAPKWWRDDQLREAAEQLLKDQEDL